MEVVNNLTGKSAIVLVPDTGEPRRTETAGRRTFNRYGERSANCRRTKAKKRWRH
jgi:hypothetical protein